jgi:hypothetical protein
MIGKRGRACVAAPLKDVRSRHPLILFLKIGLGLKVFGRALITSSESFRYSGDANGFHGKEIAQPGVRQRHDLIFVLKDKAKAPAFVQPTQLPYQSFERPSCCHIKYVIRHLTIITTLRVIGNAGQ